MRKNKLFNPIFSMLALIFLVTNSCEQEKKVKSKKQNKMAQQQQPEIPNGAIYCISGLTYLVLEKGEGKERPGPEDKVRAVIKSHAKSSLDQEETHEIQTLFLNETGKGLSEAFQVMTPKQKMRVWIPSSLQKENSTNTVVYDLELVDFERLKEVPSLPDSLISPSK